MGPGSHHPHLLIAPRHDVITDDLTLTFAYRLNGANQTTTMTVPRATRAAAGFVVPLPAAANANLRLLSLGVTPPLAGPGKDAWDLVALLGTVAKLAWLLGAEKDTVARARNDVRGARFVRSAVAAGLDNLGRDMRVPRFPPRPYSLDGDTIALWHLDEVPSGGPVTSVIDQTTQTGIVGHPGTVSGAVAGVTGKYGTALAFSASGATTINVAPSPDFNIAANGDATIEAFVSTAAVDTTPGAIIARRATESIALRTCRAGRSAWSIGPRL